MQQAALIQARLLPGASPVVEGLDIAGKTAACRTVGGDYYDFLKFPDGRIGLLVGDVAGKGMPASLMMSSLQACVHVVFDDGDELAQKITRLNKATCRNCPDNRFITFFMTVADPATGELVYTNAGHNPPLLVRAAGGFEELKGGGMILGILPLAKYQESRAEFQPGDVLVMFSDGVTEAADPRGEEFGEQRLADLVASLRGRPSAEIVKAQRPQRAKIDLGVLRAFARVFPAHGVQAPRKWAISGTGPRITVTTSNRTCSQGVPLLATYLRATRCMCRNFSSLMARSGGP